MALLQKMGWREGEGLGKLGMGDLEPLKVDFKIDRRGTQQLAKIMLHITLQQLCIIMLCFARSRK